MEYYAVEPFGAYRDNLHAAIIASTLANIHRGKNKPASRMTDFLLETHSQRKARQTHHVLTTLQVLAIPKHG